MVYHSKCRKTQIKAVDLGTVGEIIDGRFVEREVSAPQRKKSIDVKDYGEVTLCNNHGRDLLDELAKVWDLNDAKRLYVIALLRAAYGDIKNRDLMLQYATSFASEIIPGVHLSEDAVSAFLQEIGQAYSLICQFMRMRIPVDTRSPNPVISVQSVGDLQYRRQS